MHKFRLTSRYPILDKKILNRTIPWKINFICIILVLSLLDLFSTFSIAILIGNLAQTNSFHYFNLNIKIALLVILAFTLLKPQITLLVNKSLSRRQSELELHVLEKFLKSELNGIKISSSSHQYSRVLNRIEGELATLFNDFFPALIVLVVETLFLSFTIVFFVVNYPLLTIAGIILSVILINVLLRNSLRRIRSLQEEKSKLYLLSLKHLQDLISGLKESFVIGNFKTFYSRYIESKSRLIQVKFSQELETNYQRQLVEGTGIVALALFTLATQFGLIINDVAKSMLVIAFAIRLTPCFSRITGAISRANSTVPVMRKLLMDVDLNSYSDLFGNSIESGVLYSRQSIHIENISLSTNEISLVDQLSLILHPGDVLGIEGPSGSGKTMLLETIAGLRYPSTGRIVMPSIYVKNMAYLKQDAHIMDESVVDNIEYLRKNIRSKIVIDLISQLQIPNRDSLIGNVGPEVFSGGEKQRLALARTLAANPQLIFLDEPTSAQDENRRDLIIKLIGGNTNRIVIICSHSKEILAKCNKRISLG